MISGGSDNPGGLKNRAPRHRVASDDNPRPAPLIPARPAAPPARLATSAGGRPAQRAPRAWPPAADSWCRVQPRPDGSSGRVALAKISAARR
jgi:hypothetical protein